MHASWQRCRVHFLRNALAHAGKSGRRVVSAFKRIALEIGHLSPAIFLGPKQRSRRGRALHAIPAATWSAGSPAKSALPELFSDDDEFAALPSALAGVPA